MNIFKSYFIFLLFIVITWDSNGQVIAEFTVNESEGCAPLKLATTNLTNSSANTTFSWDAGNGKSSTIENPEFTYTQPGTYVLTLTTEDNGQTSQHSSTITVLKGPEIAISADITMGCVGLNVTFDVEVQSSQAGVDSVYWDFGDADGIATANLSTNHIYSFASDFQASAVAIDSLGCQSASTPLNALIRTSDVPQISESADPHLKSCIVPFQHEITISVGGKVRRPLLYDWDFKTPATTADSTAIITYDTAGQFPHLLTVIDQNNCSNSKTITASIGDPVASFSLSADTICIGDEVNVINNSSDGTFHWWFDHLNEPGDIIVDNNPKYTYTDSGLFTVRMVLTVANGCQANLEKQIYVGEVNAIYTTDKMSSCGDTVTLKSQSTFTDQLDWLLYFTNDSDTNLTSLTNNPNAGLQNAFVSSQMYGLDSLALIPTSFIDNGPSSDYDFKILLAANSKFGCADTVATSAFTYNSIRVAPSTSGVSAGSFDNKGCAPLTLDVSEAILTNSTSNIKSYDWSYRTAAGDALEPAAMNMTILAEDTVAQTKQIRWDSTGTYTIVLSIENELGCSQIGTQSVYVGASVDYSIGLAQGQNDSVCGGEPVVFSEAYTADCPTPGDSTCVTKWEWYFGVDGQYYYDANLLAESDPKMSPIQHEFQLTGWQDIEAILEYNGCQDRVTVDDMVFVSGPVIDMTTEVVCGDTATFSFLSEVQNVDTVKWDFENDGVWDSIFVSSNGPIDLTSQITTQYPDTTGILFAKLFASNSQTACENTFINFIQVPELTSNLTALDSLFGCPGDDWDIEFKYSGQVHAKIEVRDALDSIVGIDREFFVFGDMTDTLNISHNVPGDSKVRLITTDANSCTDTAELKIRIYKPQPEINLTDTIGCLPLTITVEDIGSTGADTTQVWRLWDFGDGTLDSSQNQTVSHLYDNPQLSQVSLTLYTENTIGCTDSIVQTIYIANPDSSFFISDTTTCVDSTITLTPNDLNGTDYQWIMGNGDTLFDIAPTYAYPEAHDTVYIKMSWVDTVGCNVIKTHGPISVNAHLDVGFSDNRGDFGDCAPWPAEFLDTTANAATAWWDLDDVGFNFISNNIDPFHVYQSGTFNVVLTAETPNGCRSIAVKNYLVKGPIGTLSVEPSAICEGDTVTFTVSDPSDVGNIDWDYGDGIIETTANTVVKHQYGNVPRTGNYPVDIILFSEDTAANCKVALSDSIHITEAAAKFLVDTTQGCAPLTIDIDNNSTNISNWSWTFGDGSSADNINWDQFTHTYNDPGTYRITLQVETVNEQECSDSSSFAINVFELPKTVVDISCIANDTLVLTVPEVSAGAKISWSNESWISDSAAASPRVFPTDSGTLMLYITNASNCFDSATVSVAIRPTLTDLVLYSDTTIILGQPLEIGILDDVRYTSATYWWDPIDYISCDSCAKTEVTPTENVEYVLTQITDCTEDTISIRVNVDRSFTVDVPKGFTPNGDGVNDTLFVSGWGIKELVEFNIYNRWGQKVYENQGDLNQGWDGRFNEKMQPMDTYSYTVLALGHDTDADGKPKQIAIQGHFDILR